MSGNHTEPTSATQDPGSRGGLAIPLAGVPEIQSRKVNGLGLGKSDEWYTPKSVFDALGCRFDLDVAAPVGGPLHVPCEAWYDHDSLERLWFGFVWGNFPFGGRNGLEPWLDKFFDHGNGIALTPDRTSAPWFHKAWQRTDAVMFTRKTRFLRRDGKPAGSPAFGTALWAIGDRGVAALKFAQSRGFGLFCQPPHDTNADIPQPSPGSGGVEMSFHKTTLAAEAQHDRP